MCTICQVLPSPERACPDIEGDGVGLGGKSDIMPCNLFLRFSEPDKRRETQNIQSRRDVGVMEDRRTGDKQQHHFHSFNTQHKLTGLVRDSTRRSMAPIQKHMHTLKR